MPTMPNTVHNCGGCEIAISDIPKNPECHAYAAIQLYHHKDGYFTMFFGSLDEVRDFYSKLGTELEKFGEVRDGKQR